MTLDLVEGRPPPEGPQSPAGGHVVSTVIHPTGAFTVDRRPVFSAYMRDLSPSIACVASLAVLIGGRIEDKRAPQEKTVAGCDGDRCVIPANCGAANG